MEYFPSEHPVSYRPSLQYHNKNTDTFGYRKKQIRSAVMHKELLLNNFMCVLAWVSGESTTHGILIYLEITQGKSERRGNSPLLSFVS